MAQVVQTSPTVPTSNPTPTRSATVPTRAESPHSSSSQTSVAPVSHAATSGTDARHIPSKPHETTGRRSRRQYGISLAALNRPIHKMRPTAFAGGADVEDSRAVIRHDFAHYIFSDHPVLGDDDVSALALGVRRATIELGSSVPVELVWKKILTAPDPSRLEIMHNGQKVGDCQWMANVRPGRWRWEEF